MENAISIISEEDIKNKIYVIRGVQVMLDRDLAKLYECQNGTKTINQAVKRNINKFPSDFYFQLNENEFENLKSQFGTSSYYTLQVLIENKNHLETFVYFFLQLD